MPVLSSLLICGDATETDAGWQLSNVIRVFQIPKEGQTGRFTVFADLDDIEPGLAEFTVTFRDCDGIELQRYTKTVSVHPEFDGHATHVLPIVAELKSEGKYELRYAVNGHELGSLRFMVEYLPEDLSGL